MRNLTSVSKMCYEPGTAFICLPEKRGCHDDMTEWCHVKSVVDGDGGQGFFLGGWRWWWSGLPFSVPYPCAKCVNKSRNVKHVGQTCGNRALCAGFFYGCRY